MPRTVSDHVSDPLRTGPLEGADSVGEARGGDRLLVRVGLWREEGRIVRARYRATTCASLVAYAEVACALLEAGRTPQEIDSSALRAAIPGVHSSHLTRADLVAAALSAALQRQGPELP